MNELHRLKIRYDEICGELSALSETMPPSVWDDSCRSGHDEWRDELWRMKFDAASLPLIAEQAAIILKARQLANAEPQVAGALIGFPEIPQDIRVDGASDREGD